MISPYLPLQPGAAGRHPPPRGLLFVNVVEAVNIPNLDWRSLLSKPDTFVECALQLLMGSSFKCRLMLFMCWCTRCSCQFRNYGTDQSHLVHGTVSALRQKWHPCTVRCIV